MDISIAKRRRCTTPCWDGSEPEDVFVDILKRLSDVKHLNRCKCVSKHWYKTISSNYFARCFTLHKNKTIPRPLSYSSSKPPPFCLFYHHMRGFRSVSKRGGLFKSPGFSLEFLPPPPPPPPTLPCYDWPMPEFLVLSAATSAISRIVSTSNGLLLRCDTLSSDSSNCQYYVCNPLFRQWLTIPKATPKLVRLGFICNSSGSFRIVRIPSYEDEMQPVLSVDIYASETGKWSESILENDTEGLYCPERSCAVACNGLLHWKSSKYVFVYDPYNNKNKLNRLKLPREGSEMAKECGLGECNGRLRCIIPGDMESFVVWELEDYDNEGEWSLVKRICLDEMIIQGTHGRMAVDKSYRFLCFHPFDKHVVFLWQFFRIVSCNMRAETVRHLHDLNRFDSFFHPVGLPVVSPLWPISLSPSRIVEEH